LQDRAGLQDGQVGQILRELAPIKEEWGRLPDFNAKDANGRPDYNIRDMFEVANLLFGSHKSQGRKEGAIILLFRKNTNTQIIFPGLSTTTYKSKGGPLKEYVWTSSAEFQSIDFSSLQKKITIGSNELSVVDVGENVPYKRLSGKIDGSKFVTNLELVNSVLVAEDYLFNSWLPSKATRVQERLGYRVYLFQETQAPNTRTGEVFLEYGGHFRVAERAAARSGSVGDLVVYDMVSDESKGYLRTNPKRLPKKSKRNKKSKRRRRINRR
jgi:hypothetical protein